MPVQPRVYFRPDYFDGPFVEAIPGRLPFDAAIIHALYLEPKKVGGPRDPDGLAAALTRRGVQYLIDPFVPALTRPGYDRKAPERLKRTAVAQALGVTPTLGLLRDPEARAAFGDAALVMQAGAAALAPAYLEIQCQDRGQLKLNLAFLRRARDSAPGQRVVTFLQMTDSAFRRGACRRLALAYQAAGADHVILRVRSIRHDAMSQQDFDNYLRAIEAFAAEGVELTIDCAGRAGPPLIAGGARGFATGWLHFRSVARQPFGSGGGGGDAGRYEIPGKFSDCAPADAPALRQRCPVPGCAAHLAGADRAQLRLHWLHTVRLEADMASELGYRYAARLRALGGYPAGWAAALDAAASRAA